MEFSDIIWLFLNPFEAFRGVRDFLELGGNVLVAIMVVTFLLWALIYERYSFLRKRLPEISSSYKNSARETEHHSGRSSIRRQYIAMRVAATHTYLHQGVVALAPFLVS